MVLHLKKSWYIGESNEQIQYYPLRPSKVRLIFFANTHYHRRQEISGAKYNAYIIILIFKQHLKIIRLCTLCEMLSEVSET